MNSINSFFVILLAFAIYSFVHSWLASLRLKSGLKEVVGEAWMQRYYRLLFNFLGVLTLLPILWLVWALPDRILYAVPYPWRWLCYAGQALGLWVLWASLRQTGAMDFLGLRQALQPAASSPSLTVDGLYARIRHPLYTGSLLAVWLIPWMSANLLALNIGITSYFWIGAMFEERKLARYFGQTYENYKAKTPMFVPGFGGKQ